MRYERYTLDDLKNSSDRKLFTYISFFAGGGGSSAGYKLAGGDCRFVNEFQQVAVNTYLANWPDTPHICGDIKNVTGQQIMEMTGLKVGELDILDGSPPCLHIVIMRLVPVLMDTASIRAKVQGLGVILIFRVAVQPWRSSFFIIFLIFWLQRALPYNKHHI